MTLTLLMDTDVLIKCACYSLLEEIGPPSAIEGNTAIVGAARFVARKYLEHRGVINDRAGAQERFADYVRRITILEPTDEELGLASAIEETATGLGLDLDVGESQLCAIAIMRMVPFLLTGDKRAIAGAESLQKQMPELRALRGRVVCLEQALLGITERIGVPATRARVCAEPGVDKSLTICFECRTCSDRASFSTDGLVSYVNSLRTQAATMLSTVDVAWGPTSF